MEYLLLAGLLASGIGSLALYARRRRRQREQHAAADEARADRSSEPRDVDQARPGDVIVLDEGDALVQGVVRFGEGPHHWLECRLLDVDIERWLVVRPDDRSGLIVGQRVDGLVLRGEPPEAIDHDGRIYNLERYGEARVQVQGDTGGYGVGELEFWDYRCAGSERLWIRRVGGGFRSFAGRRDPRHMIEFIPGGDGP